jgi:hypothetical protein
VFTQCNNWTHTTEGQCSSQSTYLRSVLILSSIFEYRLCVVSSLQIFRLKLCVLFLYPPCVLHNPPLQLRRCYHCLYLYWRVQIITVLIIEYYTPSTSPRLLPLVHIFYSVPDIFFKERPLSCYLQFSTWLILNSVSGIKRSRQRSEAFAGLQQ